MSFLKGLARDFLRVEVDDSMALLGGSSDRPKPLGSEDVLYNIVGDGCLFCRDMYGKCQGTMNSPRLAGGFLDPQRDGQVRHVREACSRYVYRRNTYGEWRSRRGLQI